MKNKKLLANILIPTTATLVAAAGVAGLVVGLKNHSTAPSFLNGKNVTFSAGEGKIANGSSQTTVEAGTTFDRVDQPAVTSYNPKKKFAGWVDQNGKAVYGQAKVNNDMKLHAVYNDDSDEYVTVNFSVDPLQKGPTLQGNLSVSVNRGYFFFMVNRPTAKWVVDDGTTVKQKYFKGWKIAGESDLIAENTVIDTNITLYPVFTEAVTITFDAKGFNDTTTGKVPAAGHGEIERGQQTTTLEYDTLFGEFNQPGIKYVYDSATTTPTAYFAGWYTTNNPETAVKVTDDTPITSDMTVYAKWSADTEISGYGTMEFAKQAAPKLVSGETLPDGMTFDYTPTSKIIIQLNEQTWGGTNKPKLVCKLKSGAYTSDYKVDHWQIKNSDDTWTDIKDATTFDQKTNTVRPVLKFAIDSLTVYGDKSMKLEESKQFNVLVRGGASATSTAVTWSLVTENNDDAPLFPQGIAQIDANGLVTAKSVTRSDWESSGCNNYFYVKAVSQLDATKKSYLKVSLDMPYVNNRYVWVHTDSAATPKWYYADIDNFCGKVDEITFQPLDGTSATITMHKNQAWNDTLCFGTNLGSIPANFLYQWTNFNAKIDLENSSVQAIGANFLAGCTNYNQPLNLNKIIEIKENFLKDCTSFNQSITWASNAPLVSIGENFLGGCTEFNSTITLPTITSLWIENNFLFKCTSFNKPIELPNNVYHVGGFFMSECNDFTSTLTVNCPVDAIVPDDGSLSSSTDASYIYITGFSVAGNNAVEFKNNWHNQEGPYHYRTLKEDKWTGEVTTEEFNAGINEILTAGSLKISNEYGEMQFKAASQTNPSADPRVANWELCRSVYGKSAEPEWIVPQNSDHGYLRYFYDEDGYYYKAYTPDYDLQDEDRRDSPDYWLGFMHTVANSVELYGGEWVLDTTNKWYVNDPGIGQTFFIKFNESTKKIEQGGIQMGGKTLFYGNVSDIGVDPQWTDKPAEFKYADDVAYNTTNNDFEYTHTEAIASEHAIRGHFMKVTNEATAIIGKNAIRTGLYASSTATESKHIYDCHNDEEDYVVYREDKTTAGEERTDILSTSTVVDPDTNELIICLDDDNEKFQAGDMIMVETAEWSEANSFFKAVGTTIDSIKKSVNINLIGKALEENQEVYVANAYKSTDETVDFDKMLNGANVYNPLAFSAWALSTAPTTDAFVFYVEIDNYHEKLSTPTIDYANSSFEAENIKSMSFEAAVTAGYFTYEPVKITEEHQKTRTIVKFTIPVATFSNDYVIFNFQFNAGK